MRKAIGIAVIAIVIAAAGWWYVTPIWTLQAMRDAAKNHDTARLSEHVDYPALRQNLKAELGAYLAREAAKGAGDSGSKLGAAIAMAFVGPVVDAAVSPQGVEAMFAVESRGQDATLKVPVRAGDHPIISRAGLSTFRVYGEDPSKGALVFHLEGLVWKLAGIDLPKA